MPCASGLLSGPTQRRLRRPPALSSALHRREMRSETETFAAQTLLEKRVISQAEHEQHFASAIAPVRRRFDTCATSRRAWWGLVSGGTQHGAFGFLESMPRFRYVPGCAANKQTGLSEAFGLTAAGEHLVGAAVDG